ncbi:MAG: TldD/PmbA family protein [Actinomycetota bacterium]
MAKGRGPGLLDVAKEAVDAAAAAGADYADARAGRDDTETLTVRNQEMEGIDRSTSSGVGIRVLVNGRWGFAATARTDAAEIQRAAKLAIEQARAATVVPGDPVQLSDLEPVVDHWHGPCQEDPFEVPLEEKVALLTEASRRMQQVPGITFAIGSLDFYRRRTCFASSEGAAIDQTITHSGGGIEAVAVDDGEVQHRSYPNSFRGHLSGAGYEHIRSLGLLTEAERTSSQAVELTHAPECPTEITTLVLDSGQVELQVHESIGHAVELDRVLGMEAAYAGTSFVTPQDRGSLRYASPIVNITADATLRGGLGTFAYDDEGVRAQRTPIIVDGTFERFISSRETAPVIGDVSSGTMRADGWAHLPLIRMTNISLEPGEGSLADIIGDTDDGVYMATNRSWSIDDKRVNFQFGCEIAWRIRDGKLAEPLRNPTYAGITTGFWNSCDAIAGPEEWTVWGTPNCGKGQPGQVARVGHGTSPARFRNVQIGVR